MRPPEFPRKSMPELDDDDDDSLLSLLAPLVLLALIVAALAFVRDATSVFNHGSLI